MAVLANTVPGLSLRNRWRISMAGLAIYPSRGRVDRVHLTTVAVGAILTPIDVCSDILRIRMA